MNEAPISTFERAIQATHGAKARLLRTVRVDEMFEGEPVWSGNVYEFELLDYPSASKCYAWEAGGTITAVLHTGPVDSAVKAVRASILAGGSS